MTLRKTLASGTLAFALLVLASGGYPAGAQGERAYGGAVWVGKKMKMSAIKPQPTTWNQRGPSAIIRFEDDFTYNCSFFAVKGKKLDRPVKNAKVDWTTRLYLLDLPNEHLEVFDIASGKAKTDEFGMVHFDAGTDELQDFGTGGPPLPDLVFGETVFIGTNKKRVTGTLFECQFGDLP